MKINRELPQFNDKKTLIVAVGKQEGKFYLANEGVIEELASFKFAKPKYSDREGRFLKRGRDGGIYKSGAVLEPKKEKVIIELVNRLENSIKEILTKNKIDDIYLSCPDHFKNRIKSAFSDHSWKKVKAFLPGNYHRLHPLALLGKIQEHLESEKKPVILTGLPAAKILKKAEKARGVIKGKP